MIVLLAEAGSSFGGGVIELVGTVVGLALSAAAVGAYRYFAAQRGWVVDSKNEQAIRAAVKMAVDAVEQVAKRKWADDVDRSAKKLSLATNLAKAKLARSGVKLTDDEIAGLLEAEVGVRNQMGDYMGKLSGAIRD